MDISLNSLKISNQDCSSFACLDKDVANIVLKQLDFRDYLNLALTCRHWFQLASSAPRSCKPNVKFTTLSMTSKGLFSDPGGEMLDDNTWVCSSKWDSVQALNLKLANNIYCTRLELAYTEKDDLSGFLKAYKYLTDNRSQISFEILMVCLHPSISIDTCVFKELYHMAKSFLFSYGKLRCFCPSARKSRRNSDEINTEQEICNKTMLPPNISEVIKESSNHERIFIERVDKTLLKTVLMQMLKGERQELDNFRCVCSDLSLDDLHPSQFVDCGEVEVEMLRNSRLSITSPIRRISFNFTESWSINIFNM